MKNLLKLGALSLALIAVVFMLRTNAATPDTGLLTLQIHGTSGWCEYGTHIDLGDHLFQYAAQTLTGNFTVTTTSGLNNSGWNCTDSFGVATWDLTIQSSDVVNTTTVNAAHTIPATSVKIYSPNAAVVSWYCASISGGNPTGTAINNSTVILEKNSAYGDSCRIETPSVTLTVDLTGSQAIGQYSGTLTVSVPTL